MVKFSTSKNIILESAWSNSGQIEGFSFCVTRKTEEYRLQTALKKGLGLDRFYCSSII